MPELLARNDSQQQIQSFYFIEVMNDYLQDVESGQAFLLNEIRKNTGNIITGDSNSNQNRIESIRFKKSSNVSIILTYLLLQANSLDSNK